MAIIQALLGLITRSAGKILNAIFGWAVHALFGRVTPRDQTWLSAVVGAAVAWPLLLAGVAAPKVAAAVLVLVPLPRSVPSWIVRVVWVALAAAVPLVLGVVVAAKGRRDGPREPLARRFLRGFPLTVGLALAFLIMFVSVPVMRVAVLVRRQKSADVPLVTDAASYHRVASLIVETLNRHGFQLRAAQPGWWVQAPTRILAFFGGAAFAAFVPARVEHFEDPGIAISFYASGVLLRGKAQRLTWAHGLIEEVAPRSEGLQTFTPDAQDLEREIRDTWRVFEGDRTARDRDARAHERLARVARRLATLDVQYDEWQTVYRQLLQLERALHDETQLLEDARRTAA